MYDVHFAYDGQAVNVATLFESWKFGNEKSTAYRTGTGVNEKSVGRFLHQLATCDIRNVSNDEIDPAIEWQSI